MTVYGNDPSSSTSSSSQRKSPATPIRASYYRVRKGDTLYSIAWRTGFDYRELARWNRLSAPYTIYVGQLVLTRPPPSVTGQQAKKNIRPPTTSADKAGATKAPAPPAKTAKTTAPSKKTSASSKKPAAKSTGSEKFKSKLSWRWPTSGKTIKGFRANDDTRKGIVIAGRLGQKVVAAEQGKIVYSGSGLIGYGKLIIIKHNNNYLSAYGHNRKILVNEGDWVTKGKQIAEMGNNDQGDAVLHFEIRKQGRPVNPSTMLARR